MQPQHHEALLPTHCTAFPREELATSIVARFGRLAQRHAGHAAIKYHNSILSYGELERRSNGLAQLLLALRGRSSAPVALLFRQGSSCHIAQLAILKTGTCYSHIDHELGLVRQTLILANLGASLLLCDAACLAQAEALACKFRHLCVIDIEALAWRDQPQPPGAEIHPGDDACIVYTSGSTGEPQGVVLSHRNVLAIARNHGKDFRLSCDDRAAQLCPLWTAASCSEVFSALLNGCTLYPWAIKEQGIQAFLRLLENERISTLTASPPLFRMLFSAAESGQQFSSLRLLRLGGDRTLRSDLTLFRQHFGPHCLLRLGYGAAEYMQISQLFIDHSYEATAEILPVGRPMADCELLLLDDEGQPVPTGEYGEIAVRSRYLGRGYWNNPALTQERYRSDGTDPALQVYLTRDIGYLDAAGDLHHIGRKDARLKLYGKLVLMSDIEQALLNIPGVRDAVVIPIDSGARGTELAAFVAADSSQLDAASMRKALAQQLVPELIPRTFSVLEALPLGLSNKINRLSLKQLAAASLSGTTGSAATE